MKIRNFQCILILMIFMMSVGFSQDNEKSIKSISNAEYSPTRSGELPRSTVLMQNQSSFQLFDKKNILIQNDEFNPSTKKIYKSYRYLEVQGNQSTLIEIYNEENQLAEYIKHILNSENKIDSSYNYSNKDEMIGVQVITYDSNWNMSSRIDSSLKYNRTLRWEYAYNDKNEMIKRIAFDKDGNLRDKRTYKYNSTGQEYESDLTRANGDYTLFKSYFNEYGDLTDNIWYDKDGTIKNHTKLEYKYDDNKNWITKKRSRDGELNYIWERKIEYY